MTNDQRSTPDNPFTKGNRACLAIAALTLLAGFACAAEKPLFLDNGTVRLGIDLASGGSVFSFGRASDQVNLLNHFDRGRFIQQSYYGASDGSLWNKKPWRWNPVQGGDWHGAPARLLSCSVVTNAGQPTALVSSSVPRSEEHTSELQSPCNLVFRLLLEKKKYSSWIGRL